MRSIHLDRRFHILLVASLFIGFGAVPAAVSEEGAEGLLDGKVFVVEKGKKGKTSDGKDVYLFREGKFLSTAYEKWHGFRESPYTSTVEGEAITFTVDTKSESDGSIHWQGTARGDRIDVRYSWIGKPRKWYSLAAPQPEHWARSITAWGVEDPGPPGGGNPSKLLDGKTFLVKTGETGKGADHDDYLIFQDGTFVSSGCVEIDFRKSVYSATREGDGIRFRAETVSPTHGTMIWDGIVRGDAVNATARWVHKKWYWTIDRDYWYRGSLYK